MGFLLTLGNLVSRSEDDIVLESFREEVGNDEYREVIDWYKSGKDDCLRKVFGVPGDVIEALERKYGDERAERLSRLSKL